MNLSNVLVVDDSPYLHKILKAYLGPDPVILHSAYDGESGLIEAEELQPSLILIDIDIPPFDGFEVCRQLKINPRTTETPFIVLTANSSTQDKVKAFEMGAADYITKPFKPDELRARVRAAIRAGSRDDNTAMVDPVTGLWNQTYLHALLPAQLSLAQRIRQPLSCVIVDIDSLVSIRAKHGRQISETIIKGIATLLQKLSRAEDVLCHLGDGRFVLLQPATNRTDAVRLADRKRRDIEHQLLYSDYLGAGMTCSFGVADNQLQLAGSLLDSAEEGIARARDFGGNIVMAAGSYWGETSRLA